MIEAKNIMRDDEQEELKKTLEKLRWGFGLLRFTPLRFFRKFDYVRKEQL